MELSHMTKSCNVLEMYILKSLYAFFHVHFREEVYEPMEWIPALSWGHVTFPFLSVQLNFIFISAVHFEVKLNQAFGDGFKATLKTWVSLLTLPALHRSRLTDSPCVIHSPVNHHSVIVVRISSCAISPTHTLSLALSFGWNKARMPTYTWRSPSLIVPFEASEIVLEASSFATSNWDRVNRALWFGVTRSVTAHLWVQVEMKV